MRAHGHLKHVEIVHEQIEVVLVRQLATAHQVTRELIRVVMHHVPDRLIIISPSSDAQLT